MPCCSPWRPLRSPERAGSWRKPVPMFESRPQGSLRPKAGRSPALAWYRWSLGRRAWTSTRFAPPRNHRDYTSGCSAARRRLGFQSLLPFRAVWSCGVRTAGSIFYCRPHLGRKNRAERPRRSTRSSSARSSCSSALTSRRARVRVPRRMRCRRTCNASRGLLPTGPEALRARHTDTCRPEMDRFSRSSRSLCPA